MIPDIMTGRCLDRSIVIVISGVHRLELRVYFDFRLFDFDFEKEITTVDYSRYLRQ